VAVVRVQYQNSGRSYGSARVPVPGNATHDSPSDPHYSLAPTPRASCPSPETNRCPHIHRIVSGSTEAPCVPEWFPSPHSSLHS
jgi:hypothetical protein